MKTFLIVWAVVLGICLLEAYFCTKLDDNLSRRNNRIKREIQNIKNNLMGKKKKAWKN